MVIGAVIKRAVPLWATFTFVNGFAQFRPHRDDAAAIGAAVVTRLPQQLAFNGDAGGVH